MWTIHATGNEQCGELVNIYMKSLCGCDGHLFELSFHETEQVLWADAKQGVTRE